jgi:hypothetical protein
MIIARPDLPIGSFDRNSDRLSSAMSTPKTATGLPSASNSASEAVMPGFWSVKKMYSDDQLTLPLVAIAPAYQTRVRGS